MIYETYFKVAIGRMAVKDQSEKFFATYDLPDGV